MRALPHSAVPGVEWPALPQAPAATTLALLFQLSQSEWWPRETLEHLQLAQLTALLRHARETVPFYRDRLDPTRIDPAAPLDWETWRRIPTLSRSDVQGAGEALASTAPPPSHGRVWRSSTSGSTGVPVHTLKTDLSRRLWRVFTLRDHWWHRRELGGRLAAIRYVPGGRAEPPDGLASPGWDREIERVFRTGPGHLLSVKAPVEAQAEWLRRIAPDYLVTYPSNLEALARHFLVRGLALPSLRHLTTVGEAVPTGLPEVCRQAWGLRLADVYSTVEVGYLAIQCPEHDHYHVQSEGVLVEVVDDEGRPCPPGGVGRVLATPLHNLAMPLLRYELGDYAEVGGPCPCGRGLPVLRRVLGRARNLLCLPDGRRVWATPGFSRLREAVPVRQLQLVQHSVTGLELRFVPERPLLEAERETLRQVLLEGLEHPFEVTLTEVAEIPRGAGGKHEELISRLA
jgi:phenylacetate-CoA ligase